MTSGFESCSLRHEGGLTRGCSEPPTRRGVPPTPARRRISGKSDAIDAEYAARTALANKGAVIPKQDDGQGPSQTAGSPATSVAPSGTTIWDTWSGRHRPALPGACPT